MSQDYRNLIVRRKAMDLAVCIYPLTRSFPKDEVCGLIPQMRRAAIQKLNSKAATLRLEAIS